MIADDYLDGIPSDAKSPASNDLGLLARWERLRLVYNAILIGVVLALGGIGGLIAPHNWRLWDRLLLDAFFANVLYCVGPVADGYLRRLGLGGRGTTLGLFVVGTSLAVLIAIAQLISALDIIN